MLILHHRRQCLNHLKLSVVFNKATILNMTNIKLLLALLLTLVVSACASNASHTLQKIDRISEAELARIMPKPVAIISIEELVMLSKDGNAADQIIDKIKASQSFYDLTPSQVVELNKRGVDNKVLDYIHISREQALRNNVADEINLREKNKQIELEKLKRQQLLQQQHLYDPFCRYGYYGFPSYGYGAYGSRFGPHFGIGAGFARPFGCW